MQQAKLKCSIGRPLRNGTVCAGVVRHGQLVADATGHRPRFERIRCRTPRDPAHVRSINRHPMERSNFELDDAGQLAA